MKSDYQIHRVNVHLKQLRIQKGWLQSQLAEKIGTTTENISRWERGKTCPGQYYSNQLAALFDLSLQELGLSSSEIYVTPASFEKVLQMMQELTQEVQQLREIVNTEVKAIDSNSLF